MKQQNLRVISLWLLLIISLNSISSTARLQPHHQGKLVHLPNQTADNNGIIHLDPSFKHQNDALFFIDQEMEVKANDVCDEEDEEEVCRVKRRMVAEAHLDYIYTQGINNNSQGVPP